MGTRLNLAAAGGGFRPLASDRANARTDDSLIVFLRLITVNYETNATLQALGDVSGSPNFRSLAISRTCSDEKGTE